MPTLNDKLDEIKRQKDLYILPQNLKKDVTVFGVTGTLEAGSGEVKLFDTVEHMQADQSAQNGDMAVIYRNRVEPFGLGKIVIKLEAQNTFTLQEAVTGDKFIDFEFSNDLIQDGMAMANIGSEGISLDVYLYDGENSYQFRPEWTSNDGLTYTLNSEDSEFDFPTPCEIKLRYGEADESFDILAEALNVTCNTFDGLFKYGNNKDDLYYNTITGIELNEDTNKYRTINRMDYIPDLTNALNNLLVEGGITENSTFNVYKYNGNLYVILIDSEQQRGGINPELDTAQNKSYLRINPHQETVNNETQYYEYIYDLYGNGTPTKRIFTDADKIPNTTMYVLGELSQYNFVMYGNIYNNDGDVSITASRPEAYVHNGNNWVAYVEEIEYGHSAFEGYHPMNMDVAAKFNYQIYNSSAIGKNGKIIGGAQALNHVSNQDFSNQWLDGDDTENYQSGIQIANTPYENSLQAQKNQTFVSRERISIWGDYPEDYIRIHYRPENVIEKDIDFTINEDMQAYFARSKGMFSKVYSYEGREYRIAIAANTTDSIVSAVNMENPVFVLIDRYTGEIIKTKVLNQTINLCPNNIAGRIRDCVYDFDNDSWEFITGTYNEYSSGSTGIACMSTFSLGDTLIRHDINYQVPDGSNKKARLEKASFDYDSKQWSVVVGQCNTSSSNWIFSIAKITSSGTVSNIYKSSLVYKYNNNEDKMGYVAGRLALIINALANYVGTYLLIDTVTGSTIEQLDISTSKINKYCLLYNGVNYIFNNQDQNKSYKFDSTTGNITLVENSVLMEKIVNDKCCYYSETSLYDENVENPVLARFVPNDAFKVYVKNDYDIDMFKEVEMFSSSNNRIVQQATSKMFFNAGVYIWKIVETYPTSGDLFLCWKGNIPIYSKQLTDTENNKNLGAQIFNSVEQMQNSLSPKRGDLAIVYDVFEPTPIEENSKFDELIFLGDTIILDEAYTGEQTEAYFHTADGKDGELEFYLNDSIFSVRYMGESGSKDVMFESQDGITYTRTQNEDLFDGNTIKFNSLMKLIDGYNWDSTHIAKVGKFIGYGEKELEGIYKYEFNYDIVKFTANDGKNYYLPNVNTISSQYSSPFVDIPLTQTVVKIKTFDENNRILTADIYLTSKNNNYVEEYPNEALYLKDGFLTDRFSTSGGFWTNKYIANVNWTTNEITFSDSPLTQIEYDSSEVWAASGTVYASETRENILLMKSNFSGSWIQIKDTESEEMEESVEEAQTQIGDLFGEEETE